jgi:hypothetical protein
MKKKLKKALMAGAALYGASKLMGARNKSLLAGTEDGKGGIDTIVKAKQAMTSDDAYSPDKAMKKKSLMEKAKDILKKRVDIPKGIFDPKGGQNTPYNMSVSDQDSIYEMGAGGAKYGKMIKANKGAMVMAKCKMGRNKATKIT